MKLPEIAGDSMMGTLPWIALLASGLVLSCSDDPTNPSEPLTACADFSTGG